MHMYIRPFAPANASAVFVALLSAMASTAAAAECQTTEVEQLICPDLFAQLMSSPQFHTGFASSDCVGEGHSTLIGACRCLLSVDADDLPGCRFGGLDIDAATRASWM